MTTRLGIGHPCNHHPALAYLCRNLIVHLLQSGHMGQHHIFLKNLLLHVLVKVFVYVPGISPKAESACLHVNVKSNAARERLGQVPLSRFRDMQGKTGIGRLSPIAIAVIVGPDLSPILIGNHGHGPSQQREAGMSSHSFGLALANQGGKIRKNEIRLCFFDMAHTVSPSDRDDVRSWSRVDCRIRYTCRSPRRGKTIASKTSALIHRLTVVSSTRRRRATSRTVSSGSFSSDRGSFLLMSSFMMGSFSLFLIISKASSCLAKSKHDACLVSPLQEGGLSFPQLRSVAGNNVWGITCVQTHSYSSLR